MLLCEQLHKVDHVESGMIPAAILKESTLSHSYTPDLVSSAQVYVAEFVRAHLSG